MTTAPRTQHDGSEHFYSENFGLSVGLMTTPDISQKLFRIMRYLSAQIEYAMSREDAVLADDYWRAGFVIGTALNDVERCDRILGAAK